MDHLQHAIENFKCGYNCAQSVFAAFGDVTQIPKDTALQLSSCYGGGISGTKSFCGVLSGALMVLGKCYGNSEQWTAEQKKEFYAEMRSFLDEFKNIYGTTDCSVLEDNAKNFVGEDDEEFFKQKPCSVYVQSSVKLIDQYLAEHPSKSIINKGEIL